MNCTNCGEVLSPGVTSCPKCGTVVGQAVANSTVMSDVQPMAQPVVESTPVVESSLVVETQPMVQSAMNSVQPVVQPQIMSAGMPQPSPVPVQQQPAPQPVIGGVVPAQSNNRDSKKGLVIVLIVILLVAVLGFGGYLVYDKVQENKGSEEVKDELEKWEEEEKKEKEEQEKIQKQLKVKKETKLDDETILFIIENTSSKTLSGDLEVEFYDVNNNILGTAKEIVTVSPNGEGYVYVDSYDIKQGYASYKTNISVSDFSKVVKVIDIKNNDLVSNLVEDELVIQYKNNGSDVLQSITIFALFYSGDKLVYVDTDSEFDISAGNNANLSMYLYDFVRNNISYDRYELIGSAQVSIFND